MDFFKNAKISTKLMALTIMLGAAIALAAFSGLYLSKFISNQYQQVYDEDAYAATLATQSGKLFAESRNEFTRYLLQQDLAERQESIANMEKYDREFDTAFDELEKRAISDSAKKMMSDIHKNIDSYRNNRAAVIRVYQGDDPQSQKMPEVLAVSDFGYKVTDGLDMAMKLGNQSCREEVDKIESDINRAILIVMVFVIVLLIVAMVLGMKLTRNIGNRLSKLASAAKVIGNGDLTQPMQSSCNDEIGIAANYFEEMRQHLNQSMTNIHVAAEQVAAGSRNVSEASVSLSQGAAEQASSVEELSASISEISSQTASNAENADKANDLTIHARQQAEIGDTDMKEMLAAMEAINTSSANISKIIKVIDEIAFQTNILALNAAVEAARAGQHGKGFAVVAEEVRNLAARSAKAAKETTELIEDSIAKVECGRSIAGKTADALVAIMNNVTEVADIVSAIAKASSEQKLALEQIDQGVLQVSQVVQANSATSEEAASASEQLNAQAARLRETASSFRLARNSGNSETYFAPAVKEGTPAGSAAFGGATPAPTVRHNNDTGFGKY